MMLTRLVRGRRRLVEFARIAQERLEHLNHVNVLLVVATRARSVEHGAQIRRHTEYVETR